MSHSSAGRSSHEMAEKSRSAHGGVSRDPSPVTLTYMPLSSTGRSSREMAEKSRAARGGVSQDPDNDQTFVMPLIAPQVGEGGQQLEGRT